MDDLKVIVDLLNPDVISLTETWLNCDELVYYNLTGYTACHSVRQSKRGGGVAIYVKNIYKSKQCQVIESTHTIMATEVNNGKEKHNYVVVYNPHVSNSKEMLNDFSQVLETYNKSSYVILGDFNLDMLNSKCEPAASYGDVVESYGLELKNKLPTRVPYLTSTLIDRVILPKEREC